MSNYRDELQALSHENEALRRKVADLEAERSGAKPPAPPRRARVALLIGVATSVLCTGVVGALLVTKPPPPPPVARAQAAPEPASDAPISITITMDGRVSVDGDALSDAALSERLTMYARLRNGQRAVIAADSSVAYSRVVEVMDRARAAGVTRISFAVAPR